MALAAAAANRMAAAQRCFAPMGRLGFSQAAEARPSSPSLGPPPGFDPRPSFVFASPSAPAPPPPPPPPPPAWALASPVAASASKGKLRDLGWDRLLKNHVEPPPELQDAIAHNEHVQVDVVPGLEEAIKEKNEKRRLGTREAGRKPRLGRVPVAGVKRRFFVEVSIRDFSAIVIPNDMKPLLVEKFKLKTHKNKRAKNDVTDPKLCAPVRITKCCEYMVHISWFAGHLVLFKGWDDLMREMKLNYQDLLVFKYDGDGFKLKVFRFISSTEEMFVCLEHGRCSR